MECRQTTAGLTCSSICLELKNVGLECRQTTAGLTCSSIGLELKNVGLRDSAVRALAETFLEGGPLSNKLQKLDLSDNFIGFHKCLRK
jgi:hypothetical protein